MLNSVQTSLRHVPEELAETTPSVLIVDDDDTAAAELAETLELEGFNCIAASSPEQALSLIGAFPTINVVITDFYLRGKATATHNGVALIENIREGFPSRTFDFIVVSGDQDVLADCVITGAGQFLAKPIAPESICSMVRDASSQSPRATGENPSDESGTSLHEMVQAQADTIARLTDALNEARSGNRKAISSLDRMVSAASIARKCNDDTIASDVDDLLRYVVGQGYAIKALVGGNAKVQSKPGTVTITPINS